ncbi:histidine kinase [uncultured Lacinutrix sp.]|uniref:sensor histidine kinase n=1 Tax=uncultured Lacinutrix sp. TaxID=574032 RepID=UPI00261A59DC|nr:histidine kinase [uncultured Lacinutrix sp.]
MKAQQSVYIHFSENEGLPDKEVYRLLEDENGLLWLATNSGVYSYDGEVFVSYTHPEQKGASAFGIQFDNKGRLWYTTMNSDYYYIEDGKVHFYTDLRDRVGNRVTEFDIINDTIHVNTFTGFYKINKKTIYKVDIPNLVHHHSNLHEFKGRKYIFNEDVLYEVKKDLLTPLYRQEKETPRARYSNLFNDGRDLYIRFLVDNKNSFYKVDSLGIKSTSVFNAINNRIAINHLKKNKNSFWFFTADGAYQYNTVKGKLVLENHFLKGKNVTDVIIDRNGNYIFSTVNNGLYILPDPSVERIKNESFNHGVISSFTVINDDLINYVSNHDELNVVDLKGGKHISRKIDRFLNQKLYYDAFKDRGLLFNNSELELFDPVNLKIFKQVFDEAPKNVERLNDNAYIVTTPGRTRIVDNDFKTLKSFSGRSREVVTTKSGHFYIWAKEGCKWSSDINNDLEIVKNNNKGFLINGVANHNNTDKVWLSRPNWGLYLVEKGKIIRALYDSNGLLDKNITALDANEDNLWIATRKGIQSYNYKTEEFINFGYRDGIIQPRILKLQVTDKYVWYQTMTGIFRFPIDKKKKSIFIPELYFSKIKIENQLQKVKDEYEIDYSKNVLDVSFMINGFKSLKEYQFEYNLEGSDAGWVSLDLGKHNVNFNSLPSGKHVFKVRAKNVFEDFYTNPIQFRINVKLPYWKRWWFSSLIALLTIIGVVVFFRVKAKRKEKLRLKELKQVEVEGQLVALKLENLRSQMNPHFIFNALNSIQEYIVLNQKKLASDYLGKFADLIRTYLNHSTKGNITLQEEIDCLEMYLELEKLRFEDKLYYSTTVSGTLNANNVLIPTMLVQPYVENALKHGLLHRKDNRNLEINFIINKEAKLIKCIILDNGVGRDKAKRMKARSYKNHKPFATKATEDRLDLLNYGKEKEVGVIITDLFENESAIGTKVEISIPYTID